MSEEHTPDQVTESERLIEHVARAIAKGNGVDNPDLPVSKDFDTGRVIYAWERYRNRAIEHIAAFDAIWVFHFRNRETTQSGGAAEPAKEIDQEAGQ